jgi:phosphinothricin acetyltransferase
MQIRLARPTDGEAIRAIYNAEVVGGTNTFDLRPRTAEEQVAWLEDHAGAYPAVVAVVSDGAVAEEVAGFGSISAYRDRPAYATTVENSVYVDPRFWGRGVGKAILEELITLAAGHGFHAMIARIVGENEVSIGLHRACGITMVGIERQVCRKHGRWLDVVELQRRL